MGIGAILMAKAYGAANSAASILSAGLPEPIHPGKRACRALRNLRDAPSGPYFARATLASRWQSALLLRHVLQLSRPSLRTFLEQRVSYEGASFAERTFNGSRPVILATPHYGVPAVGFLAAVHRMGRHRPINLLHDAVRPTPQLNLLFERGGIDVSTLLAGFAGAVAGIRALNRSEYLAMTPDVFRDGALTPDHTLAVPFFGRMLRVAPGTAFFALRTGAWVVPVFAAPARRLGLRVTLGRPIDPHRFTGWDESQAIFMLTRALFASFERELRRTPEHWHYWERFPQASTAVDPPGRLEDDAPLRLLRNMCDASPRLLQDVPELELLVK
jgi:lauroyl/myristoyl acyltransferase